MADLQWEDGSEVVASPRQILRRQLGAARRARADRQGRHRARVHGLQRHLRGRLAQGLPRPRAGQPLQRRLLAGGHRARGAADPPHPQRDGRRGDDRRELQGRVQPRPARDQLPLRRRAAGGGRPRHLQDRRQGDRRAGGHGAHLHRQVQRGRGQLVPHPLLAGAARTANNAFGEDQTLFDRFVAGQIAVHARAHAVLRPADQLLQALRRGLVRAHGRRVGQGQPHLLAALGRARALAADREPAARAPT